MDYKKKYEELLEKNAVLQEQYIEKVKEKDHKLPALFNSIDSSFQLISPIYDENDIVVDYYYKNVNNKFISKIGKTREEIIDKRGTDIIGFIEDYWFKTIEEVIKIGYPIIYRNYSEARKTHYELYSWKVNENLDSNVTVYMKQIGGDCKVTVSDNGVGIPFEKQADLFSFKTNRTTRGTLDEKGSGLGLLICREYLERNNGAISVKSEIGHGSEFSFTLPLVAS